MANKLENMADDVQLAHQWGSRAANEADEIRTAACCRMIPAPTWEAETSTEVSQIVSPVLRISDASCQVALV